MVKDVRTCTNDSYDNLHVHVQLYVSYSVISSIMAMETDRTTCSFAGAVQYTKACVARDDEEKTSRSVGGGSRQAMARAFVTSFDRFCFTKNVVGLVLLS